MVVLIVKVNCKPTLVFFLIVLLLIVMFVFSSDSFHQNTRPINRPSPQTRNSCLGTGSVDGPSVLMEGVRGEHEHHNQQKNDKEEDKGRFAILLLQLVQPYAATCEPAVTLKTNFSQNEPSKYLLVSTKDNILCVPLPLKNSIYFTESTK